jgi:hypothetical protein
MTPNERTILIFGAIGVAVIGYMINQNTDGAVPVPQTQSEAQMMGLGTQAANLAPKGSPLDMSVETHFWTPGYDDCNPSQPTVNSRHRYPAVPGGNVTYVMHHGWSSVAQDAPAGNAWFANPPEASVL